MKKPHSTTGVIDQVPTTYARALARARTLEGLGIPTHVPAKHTVSPVPDLRDEHDRHPHLGEVA